MKFQEVAAKTKDQALALAARYGYGEPVFSCYSGSLVVLRFEVRS